MVNNKAPAGEMTVANLHGVGDLRIERRPIPSCGEDEVLVRIKACGICGSDVGRVFRTGTYHFPTVPGHEFAGEVVFDETGKDTGKRVAIFPILPCFRCENCRTEHYAQCSDYDYYGSRRDGGYAEYLAVKRFNLVEIPDNVSYEEAAMCEPVAVAHCAVAKLGIAKGDRVLITGAGPIGLAAGRFALAAGAASVEMIDNDPAKIRFCAERGFSAYGGGAVDCVLEGTGALLGTAVEAVKPFGRIVLMGNPSADNVLSPKIYQLILRKELSIRGTWNSVYGTDENDWRAVLDAVSAGTIPVKDLITHRVPLEKCVEALTMMKDKTEPFCKVMIKNDNE